MRKIGMSILLSIVTVGIIVGAAPKIEVDDPIFDFGEVLEGIAVSHVFVLTNSGDEPLMIEKVLAACGCTTTELAKDTLEPGETVKLETLVDTAGFGGNINKSISVYTNDPETEKLTLRVTGNVKRAEDYHVTVADLDYLFYLLIDLREEEDYATGHLMGAINIPYAQLQEWIDRLPTGVLVILYDQDGSLSDLAAQTLEEAGFYEARSLLGGLNEWKRQFKDKYVLVPSKGEEEDPQ